MGAFSSGRGHAGRLAAPKAFAATALAAFGYLAGCENSPPGLASSAAATGALASAVVTEDRLESGPLEAVVVYRAPAKNPPPKAAEPPRPKAEPPKPEPPRPDPPKPAGPSAALVAAQRELTLLRADASALSAAQAELSAAQAELRTAGGAVAAQLQSAEQQLQATSLAREMEIQQVRSNQCCSVCGNSKTELEKSGKRFLDHLLEVKGTVARCAPSKLSEVERKYDQRLAAQRAQVQQLKTQVGPQRAAAQAKVDAAQAKLEAAKRDREAKIKAAQDKVTALGG